MTVMPETDPRLLASRLHQFVDVVAELIVAGEAVGSPDHRGSGDAAQRPALDGVILGLPIEGPEARLDRPGRGGPDAGSAGSGARTWTRSFGTARAAVSESRRWNCWKPPNNAPSSAIDVVSSVATRKPA